MKSVCVSYYYHRHSRRDMLLSLPLLLAVVTTALALVPTISLQQQDSDFNFSAKQNFANYKTTISHHRPLAAKSRPRLIDLMDNFTNSRRDNEGEAGGTDVLGNKSLTNFSSSRPPGSRTTTDRECQGQQPLEHSRREDGNPLPCQTAREDLSPAGDGNSIRARGGALLLLGPHSEKIRDIIEKSSSSSTITTAFPGVSSNRIGGIRKPQNSTITTTLPGPNSGKIGQIKKTKSDEGSERSGLDKIIGELSNDGDDDGEFNRNNLIEFRKVSRRKSDEGGDETVDEKLDRNESEMSSEREDFESMDHAGKVSSLNGSQSIPYAAELAEEDYVPVHDQHFHRTDILQSASLKLDTNESSSFPPLRQNQSITSWSTPSPPAVPAPPTGEGGLNKESFPSMPSSTSQPPLNYDDYNNGVGERRRLSPGSITGEGGRFPTTMSTGWDSAELDNIRQTEASSTSTSTSPFAHTWALDSDDEEKASSIPESRTINTPPQSSFHIHSVKEEVETTTTWGSENSLQPSGEQTLSQFSTGTNLVAADVESNMSMPKRESGSSDSAGLGESAHSTSTIPYYKFRLEGNDVGSSLSTVTQSTTTPTDTMQKAVHPTKPRSYGTITYSNKTQRHPMNPIANLRSHLDNTPSSLSPRSLKTSSTNVAPTIWTPYYGPEAYLFPTVNKVTKPTSTMDDEDLVSSFSFLNNSTNSDGSGVLGASKVIQQPEIPWPVKKEAVVEGDLVLGGLMMVHEREDTITCGPVMPQGGIQALEAMLYTLDRLNFAPDPLLPNITLGAHILDDCDKDTYGLEMAVDFIKGRFFFSAE